MFVSAELRRYMPRATVDQDSRDLAFFHVLFRGIQPCAGPVTVGNPTAIVFFSLFLFPRVHKLRLKAEYVVVFTPCLGYIGTNIKVLDGRCIRRHGIYVGWIFMG